MHDELSIRKCTIKVPDHLECVWTIISGNFSFNMKNILIGSIYYPPEAPYRDELIDHIITSIDTIKSSLNDLRVVLIGDLNDLDKVRLCRDLNLQNVVTKPTHRNSILDVILTDAECYTAANTTNHPPIGLSIHQCVLSTPSPPPPPTYAVRTFRPLRESNIREFGQWITGENWVNILREDNVNDAVEKFEQLLQNRYEHFFPEKRCRIRSESKPWITPEIIKLMARRRRAWGQGRQDLWRALYERIKQLIKIAKKTAATNVEKHDVNSIKFAKGIKNLLGCKKKSTKLNLFDDLSNLAAGERIRDHFTGICTKHERLDPSKLPAYLPANDDLPVIDRIAIYNEIGKLKIGKSSPPGEIPKIILKEFRYELSIPLEHIYNLSLRTGVFPDRWKGATIIPLPKKKIVSELGELRPVSLTPDLGKILEGFVARVMLSDIRPNIDRRQYGNLKGKSTCHYLIYLLDEIYRGLDQLHNIASLILIDFKKAFDYVNHNVAIADLLKCGCRPSIIPFVINFLSDRRHRVLYQGETTAFASITCGVPQGTVCGPVVFLALVNSLWQEIERRAKFVDDLSAANIISTKNEIVFPMQRQINTLTAECKDKDMETNPIKSEGLYMCPVLRPLVLPDLHIDGTPLPVVSECKLLGVHITDNMNWKKHVSEIKSKANKCIFILIRARKFQFTVKTMLTLYIWYIRTTLEYACPVWHPGLTNQQHTELERIQKRCLRIILGNQYVSYAEALQRLNISTLYDRRERLCLRLGRSILRSPEHRDLLPPTMGQVHGRNTRRRNLLRPIRARTARYKNTFIPYIVKRLNQEM